MNDKLNHNVSYTLTRMDGSKLLAGIAMLMLNIGSKYVELGLSETQEDALRNVLTKEVLIFAMVFTATRDIITSLLMTAAFFIISDFLFNEKSRFCVSSDLIYKFSKKNTTRNMNEPVTDKQVSHALDILQRAQHQHQQQ